MDKPLVIYHHSRVYTKTWMQCPACWTPAKKINLNSVLYANEKEEVTCLECKEMLAAEKSICPSEVLATLILKNNEFKEVCMPMTELANIIDKSLKEMTLLYNPTQRQREI